MNTITLYLHWNVFQVLPLGSLPLLHQETFRLLQDLLTYVFITIS